MKKVKFYNSSEGGKICEGILEEDSQFVGGYKVTYQNQIISIKHIKLIKDENKKNN